MSKPWIWGWHPWFAWRPVQMIDGGWCWMCFIERKLVDDYGTHVGPEWRYRREPRFGTIR
jgi:hypothetical protein